MKVRGDLEGKPPWESRSSDLLHWLRTVACPATNKSDGHEDMFHMSPLEVRNRLQTFSISLNSSQWIYEARDFPS